MVRLRMIAWMMVLAVGFQAAASLAADPTGTWKWERTHNGRTMTSVLTLQAKGDSLTGAYTGRRGEPTKIEKGKIDGDMISFQITFERNDNKFVIQYRGKVSDDRITGKIEFTRDNETRAFDWKATRVIDPKDVVGTWLFKVDRDNGDIIETRLEVTQADGKFKGMYTSHNREREAKEIAVSDGKLRFVVAGEREGNAFSFIYNGKISGNKIKGKVDYDFNDNTGTLDFTGKKKVAPSVAGTWLFKIELDNGNIIEPQLVVTQVADKLKGVYTSRNRERDVKEITSKDDKLRFVVTGETDEGNTFSVIYNGKITGHKIEGKVDYDFNDNTGTLDFTGKKKVAPSPTGAWLFKIELDDGDILEQQLVVTQAAGKLKGVYNSRDREHDVKEIAFTDGKLRFAVTGETDEGDTFSATYNGKIAGDKIEGKVDYEFNDESGSLAFTGGKKVTDD